MRTTTPNEVKVGRHAISGPDPKKMVVHLKDGTNYRGRIAGPGSDGTGHGSYTKLVDIINKTDGDVEYGRIVHTTDIVYIATNAEHLTAVYAGYYGND